MKNYQELEDIAKRVRVKIIRMLARAGSGHPGGSLSPVEILTYLFFNILERAPENMEEPDRHRFVLSKGHGVPTLYALFSEVGILSDDDLDTLRVLDSRLQGHPDRCRIPALEASTGSLGQGMSIAQGMALAAKIDKKDYNVFSLVGDGEIQEGEIWECAMSAPDFNLDNFCVILDYNKSQIDGYTKDVMDIEPICDKLRAFKWHVLEIDGHNYEQIDFAIREFQNNQAIPTFIVAHTVKGKGVSFMENNVHWHGVAPNKEESEKAINEILSSDKTEAGVG